MDTKIVYLVMARFPDGASHVLLGFTTRERAEKHRDRCLAVEWDDNCMPSMSPAMILGCSDVYVRELPVHGKD